MPPTKIDATADVQFFMLFGSGPVTCPLSQLTHLQLINVRPRSDFISFLVGYPIDSQYDDVVYKALQAGLSPKRTLECLRISCQSAQALINFGAYVAWKEHWSEYKHLTPKQRVERPAPPPLDVTSETVPDLEMLYDLAPICQAFLSSGFSSSKFLKSDNRWS